MLSAARGSLCALLILLGAGAFAAPVAAQSNSQAASDPPARRVMPHLERSRDPAVISTRLQATIKYLQQVIEMQSEPRTPEGITRADAVLYTAYKYVGAAHNGVESRLDLKVRQSKFRDPMLAQSLKTLATARNVHVRGALNANKRANPEGTIGHARQAIALIEQVLAIGF